MRYYWAAHDTELQVDLDKRPLKEFHRRLGILRGIGLVRVIGVKEQPSKTKGHWHVTITLAESLPAMERVLLQCALGSDPVREMLNWARVRKDDPVPILFIEPRGRWSQEELEENDYEPLDDLGSVFDPEFDEPECLACECDIGAGRCSHMEQFQPALQFIRYGEKE